MPRSRRFITLNKELNRLRKQFLPKASPTGEYTDRQLALTIAYVVLAHAEIEAYLEDRVWEVAISAKKDWDSNGKTSRTLLGLLAFSGEMMELPPNSLTPIKASKSVSEDRIKIGKKIDLAINFFKGVIDQNHGIKESNILALLLTIGLDSDGLDTELIAILNTFGEQRGLVAHSSANSYRTKQIPDPVNELNRINQIIQGMTQIDRLITDINR
jgi:hypothetical protein